MKKDVDKTPLSGYSTNMKIKLVELRKGERYGFGNFELVKSEMINIGLSGVGGSIRECWVAYDCCPAKGASGWVFSRDSMEKVIKAIEEPSRENEIPSGLAKKIIAIRERVMVGIREVLHLREEDRQKAEVKFYDEMC